MAPESLPSEPASPSSGGGRRRTALLAGVSFGGTPPADLATARGPSDFPFGLTISGRPARIQRVVRTIIARTGVRHVVVDSGADKVTLSLDRGYGSALTQHGDLAGDATFAAVVPDVDRADFVAYANFDSPWRATIAKALGGHGKAFLAETEPLQGVGVSYWGDGTDQHLLVEVTTD